MAGIKKGGFSRSEGSEYSVIYSSMRGIDLSGDASSVDRFRFAYAENMYKDYEGESGDAVESIPGFRKLASLGEKIKKIFIYKPDTESEYIVIQSGTELYISEKEALLKGNAPTLAMSNIDGDITAVSFGGEMLFFGGMRLAALGKNGAFSEIVDDSGRIYIPYTYINGKEAEGRNMLTRLSYESYTIGSAYKHTYGTESLTYQITDIENKTCRVTGITDAKERRIYIPNRIKLADEYYTVTEIAPHAFAGNTALTAVIITEGVKTIGKFAFADCTSLNTVILSDSVEFLDNACFARCTALMTLHIGLGLTKVGSSPLSQCLSLSEISYASDESDFNKIENVSYISGYQMVYGKKLLSGYISIPVFGPVTEIISVTADGEELDFSVTYMENGLSRSVRIYAADLSTLDGKEFLIKAKLSSNRIDYTEYSGFMNSSYSVFFDTFRLIGLSTVATVYDGRIFLGGNVRHPSLLFFSSRDRKGNVNPFYFSEYDYLDVTRGRVTNLLPTQSSLAVYTDDGGECSISYLTARDTGIDLVPRIYPTEYIHSGLSHAHSAISFLDEQLFLSGQGLIRLGKLGTNLERSVSIISNKVNKALLSLDLSDADMTVWLGYLAIGACGKIFLADPRQSYYENGIREYEWYLLSDIGTYKNDLPKYRYASVSDGYSNANTELCDLEVPDGKTVYSAVRPDGAYVYYTEEDGERISVYKTEERHGGEFSALSAISSDGTLLFFGTASGDICVFNNDKRGLPPDSYYLEDGFDAEEYRRRFGKSIAKEFYSFAGHRPKYILKTKRDDCGIPHLTKSTVKHSMTLKLRSISSGKLSCEIKTDRGTVREALLTTSGTLCFDGLDFAQFSFDCEDSFTRPLNAKEKGWIEKQITVTSAEFNSPISVYNIAYRFRVKGRIKKS